MLNDSLIIRATDYVIPDREVCLCRDIVGMKAYAASIRAVAEKTNWAYVLGTTINATEASPLVNKDLFYQTLTNCSQPGAPTVCVWVLCTFGEVVSCSAQVSLINITVNLQEKVSTLNRSILTSPLDVCR